MAELEAEAIDELIRRYADAATVHGRATERSDYLEGNAAYQVISSVYRELRRRGPEAQRALLRLLSNPEPGVRCWAASHALEFSPGDGERTLSELAGLPKSLVGFSARMTLKQWQERQVGLPSGLAPKQIPAGAAVMGAKQRFELAVAGYKDVSEQLRRWEAAQRANGVPSPDAKRAAHRQLAAFDVFALHRAFTELSEASAEAEETFEREIGRFEAATAALQQQLLFDGVPKRDPDG